MFCSNVFSDFVFLFVHPVQLPVYTPPQRCWTLVRYVHKVRIKLHLSVFSNNVFHGFLAHYRSVRFPTAQLCVPDRPKLLNLHLLNSGTKDVPITVGVLGTLFKIHSLKLLAYLLFNPTPLFMVYRVYEQHHQMKQSQWTSKQSP